MIRRMKLKETFADARFLHFNLDGAVAAR